MLRHARLHCQRGRMAMAAVTDYVHRLAQLQDARLALAARLLDAPVVLATGARAHELVQMIVQLDHQRTERTRDVVDRMRGSGQHGVQIGCGQYGV